MNESKIYKGIEYIRLEELPEEQRSLMLLTIKKDLFIKIMIEGKILSDCLQYKDYSFWYKSVYMSQPETSEEHAVLPVDFKPELALNN